MITKTRTTRRKKRMVQSVVSTRGLVIETLCLWRGRLS